jgi:hypothetical protein
MRMLKYTNLYRVRATYHRHCYTTYYPSKNVQAARNKALMEQARRPHDEAFQVLKIEIAQAVLTDQKKSPLLHPLHIDMLKF